MNTKIKKLLTFNSSLMILASIFSISCGTSISIDNTLPVHEYFVDKNIQDNKNRIHMDSTDVIRGELRSFPTNILSHYKTSMMSGEFGEIRKFYGDFPGFSGVHTGIDVLLPVNTEIISPVDGNLVASYWYNKEEDNFAKGIGGVSVIETQLNSLQIPEDYKKYVYIKISKHKILKMPKMAIIVNNKINPKFNSLMVNESEYMNYFNNLSKSKKEKIKKDEGKIYLSFMHLSKHLTNNNAHDNFEKINYEVSNESANLIINTDIYPNHPRKIKRKDIIGHIGSIHENGGWMPHVHLNAYWKNPFHSSKYIPFVGKNKNESNRDYNIRKNEYFQKVWKNIHPLGLQAISNSRIKTINDPSFNLITSMYSYMDPNNIYQLYNQNTKIVKF